MRVTLKEHGDHWRQYSRSMCIGYAFLPQHSKPVPSFEEFVMALTPKSVRGNAHFKPQVCGPVVSPCQIYERLQLLVTLNAHSSG